MKLPFQTLAVLFLFVGCPLALMQLTTRSMEPAPTYAGSSVVPNPSLAAFKAIGNSLGRATSAHRTAFQVVRATVGNPANVQRMEDYVVRPRDPWLSADANIQVCEQSDDAFEGPFSFDPISFDIASFDASSFDASSFDPASFDASSIDAALFDPAATDPKISGLIVAAERALVSSWKRMQPTFIALPDELGRIDYNHLLNFANSSDSNSHLFESLAWRPIPTRSPEPSADGRTIPGLIVAAERAVLSSWRQLQPTIVAFPAQLQRIRQALASTVRGARWMGRYKAIARRLPKLGNQVPSNVDNR